MNVNRLLVGAASILVTGMAHAATTYDVVCSYAPSQSSVVNRITSVTGGASLGAAAMLQATGLSLVAHSSGGYILTGAGGYVAGTLLSPITVPLVVAATVTVGGTAMVVELTCAPKNHQDAVKKVKEITEEFNRVVRETNAKAALVRDNAESKVRELNESAIVGRDAAAEKIRAANERGIAIRDGTVQLFSGYFGLQ